jgi:hypothetical protein
MAKLPNLAAGRIWRTVVVAGAMLGTPALAVADAPANPCAAPKKDDAKKQDAPKKDDTTAKKDDTKKDDGKKPAPKPAPKRPRSDGSDRPTGRGFILS